LPASLFFAAIAAAHACAQAHQWLCNSLGVSRALPLEAALAIGAGLLGLSLFPEITERVKSTEPLPIGLGAGPAAIVDKLIQYTGPEARILWESPAESAESQRWTPLLPILTGRSFIGGLDPDATIEHSGIGIVDQALNGRHISTWSNTALEDYCRLYNIGWVACWSPTLIHRLRAWPAASPVCTLDDHGPGFLFAIKRDVMSFTLKGQTQVVHADSDHITLADVAPQDGVVVLSLHYQRGMRALPTRVQVEREPDAYDPIGFLRLRLAGRATRVTLTWDDR
jgi:hypothetical protein